MASGHLDMGFARPEAKDQLLRSFRDPLGELFVSPDGVYRLVYPEGQPILERFLRGQTASRLLEQRRLVRSEYVNGKRTPAAERLASTRPGSIVVQHERIPFPSYPYEWAPPMLHAAGSLTLELAERVLPEGLGLKDATPYNILFRGPTPVFVDLLSFEPRQAGDATWLPYAQFVRMFLLPLLAHKYLGNRLDEIFLTRRDGLEVEEIYARLSWGRRLRRPFLSLVSFPVWLGRWHNQKDTSIYQRRIQNNPERARFILRSLFHGLRRALRSAAPRQEEKSTWHNYMRTHSYTGEEFAAKEEFIRKVLADFAFRSVLDVGCNTGHFSIEAARAGARVLAIDSDPVVVGTLWRTAAQQELDILPLVINLARPTPAVGWHNSECSCFLDRVRGRFDLVLMLAVVHHLMVTERIPLPEILRLVAELTRDAAVIEYVGPEDPMFHILTRGRDGLHQDLTPQRFEAACQQYFRIVCSRTREGSHRRLYLLRKGAAL